MAKPFLLVSDAKVYGSFKTAPPASQNSPPPPPPPPDVYEPQPCMCTILQTEVSRMEGGGGGGEWKHHTAVQQSFNVCTKRSQFQTSQGAPETSSLPHLHLSLSLRHPFPPLPFQNIIVPIMFCSYGYNSVSVGHVGFGGTILYFFGGGGTLGLEVEQFFLAHSMGRYILGRICPWSAI